MTAIGKDIALFPLNTVLFPGGLLPLRIFEQRYLEMAKTCLRDGAPFGVCLIREGGERFRVLARRIRADGLILADIELLVEAADTPLPERFGACRQLIERIVAEHGEQLFARPFRLDSSAWVGARLAEVLPLPAASRQRLLELDDSLQRLEIVQRLIVESAQASNSSDQ